MFSLELLLLTTGGPSALLSGFIFIGELPSEPACTSCSSSISSSDCCTSMTTGEVLASFGGSGPYGASLSSSLFANFSEDACFSSSFSLSLSTQSSSLPSVSGLLVSDIIGDATLLSSGLSSRESTLSASLSLRCLFLTGEDGFTVLFLSGLLSDSLLSSFLYRFRIRPPLGVSLSFDLLLLESLPLLWLR